MADAKKTDRKTDGGVTGAMPPVVTIKEACRLLTIGRTKFNELVKAGRIPVLALGSRILVPLASIEAFLASLPSKRPALPAAGRSGFQANTTL